MSFSGFSEDDIRKLTKPQDNKQQKGSNKTTSKKVSFKQNNSANYGSRSKTFHNHSNPVQEIPENAKLSIPNKLESKANVVKKASNGLTIENAEEQKQEHVMIETPNEPSAEDKPKENELVKEEKKLYKDLNEFEARQKLIEEQNRKRKELLAKALADRTKQTQKETQKLNEIQEEFKKLDLMLSGDVKILRKEIELASIEYMECQKRYHKIEKEYLEAKLLMHQKQEKKEMLTEHLCTIIEKNEERKAEKLNELLLRLQLAPPEDDLIEAGDHLIQEKAEEVPNK